MFSKHQKRTVALLSAVTLTAGLLGGSGLAQARSSTFSAAAEAKKMDAIATPKLDWYSCYQTAECATVKVPRDYDKPKGAKVELALLKVKAKNPKKRIGSLFVNPGGPGGSATELAYFSEYYFSPAVTDRFDIVGMDPRGIAFSDNVECFPGARQQDPVLTPYESYAFPMGSAQEKAWLKSDKAEGKACSSTTLAKSMSTTEVARDMELMRRAVGDSKLSYLGFSYGSYLGQIYANMFPNRFRAVAVDGVLDPVAVAGDAKNQNQPLGPRRHAAEGAYKALHEILVRCDKVGGAVCAFAPGNPTANLALIAARLKAHPIEIVDDFSGETYTYTYADMVADMFSSLYDPAGYEYITELLSYLIILTEPPAPAATKANRAAQLKRQQTAATKVRTLHDQINAPVRPRAGFPYYNGLDAYASVWCTDSKETTKGANYPKYAAQADVGAPYFGRLWTWATSFCAGDVFTGNDEDVYSGPFNTKTAAPVLFVGNYYDPATNYDGAVSAAKRMPNSGLLSSNSWGHTAYGTSDCATSGIDNYLITGKLPAKGKVCVGDIQPFVNTPEEDLSKNAARQKVLTKSLKDLAATR